jgi:hypothetical protein
MSRKPASQWTANKAVARGILQDRALRRRFIARLLFLLLAVFAIGLWVIPGWLRGDIWRFFLWWGGCGLLATFMVIMAFYDALAVIREEREKIGR